MVFRIHIKKRLIILVLFALLSRATIIMGKVIYVEVSASGAGNGSSWADAYTNLQDALVDANMLEMPVEIRVAQGIYTPDQGGGNTPGDREATFKLIDAITLKGSYAGFSKPDPNARSVDLYETTLSGDLLGNDIKVEIPDVLFREPTRDENSQHVLTLPNNVSVATLDGFLVYGGNPHESGPFGRGGGLNGDIVNANTSITVRNCTFSRNSAAFGGGVCIRGGYLTLINCMFDNNWAGLLISDCNATLTNCTFSNNKGGENAGGVRIHGSNAVLVNCTLTNNFSNELGGGMLIGDSNVILTNCKFTGNSSGEIGGGFLSTHWSNSTMISCTFIGNSAVLGGGIYNRYGSTASLINCTFAENSAHEGAGLYNDKWEFVSGGSSASLTNCILRSRENEIYSEDESMLQITYSNIHGGWSGVGNIDTDPLFVDPLGPDGIAGTKDDDLCLAPLSSCIDAGDPNYVPGPNETDIDDSPRIVSGCVDMGAFEFQGILHVDDDALGVGREFRELAGTEYFPFKKIQDAIDIAKDGYTVRVQSGVYGKIDFLGKSITVKGTDGAAVIEAPSPDGRDGGEDAVTFHTGEGPDSVLKNFIIRNSGMAVSLNSRSRPTISNLTIVDNDFGIAAYENSIPDISNCIFWNNKDGNLFQCEVRYSCVEGGAPGEGNISVEPLFVDATSGDYHLQSEGWRWSSYTETWTYDDVTSRCIDAGDPDSPLGEELMSWERDPDNLFGLNRRINMGTFGGTWQASMPPTDLILPEYETIPPEPNPAQWAPDGAPAEVKSGDRALVRMKAVKASDVSGWVEYFFECTTEPDLSSNWQISSTYTVSADRAGQGLYFRVKARDLYANETAWSEELPVN